MLELLFFVFNASKSWMATILRGRARCFAAAELVMKNLSRDSLRNLKLISAASQISVNRFCSPGCRLFLEPNASLGHGSCQQRNAQASDRAGQGASSREPERRKHEEEGAIQPDGSGSMLRLTVVSGECCLIQFLPSDRQCLAQNRSL